MLNTIILLTGSTQQQRALSALLSEHNPALSFRFALTLDDLAGIGRDVMRNARLVSFTSGVIVPAAMLGDLGHGAYNFHPGPPHYPGWAPAHFALYENARTFGTTAHAMAERVDSGPIVGVELFAIPEVIALRELEHLAFVRLAHLFWHMSRDLACAPAPLPALPVTWSGTRSTKRMCRDLCEIPGDISAPELKRRLRAFHGDDCAIPPAGTPHGQRFRFIGSELREPETPRVDAPSIATAS